jgi:hypothetical protein
MNSYPPLTKLNTHSTFPLLRTSNPYKKHLISKTPAIAIYISTPSPFPPLLSSPLTIPLLRRRLRATWRTVDHTLKDSRQEGLRLKNRLKVHAIELVSSRIPKGPPGLSSPLVFPHHRQPLKEALQHSYLLPRLPLHQQPLKEALQHSYRL